METAKINLNEEPKDKKETEKLNVTSGAENYAETISENKEKTAQDKPKKKGLGEVSKMAAAGAVGGMVGGGVVRAANPSQEGESVTEEPVAEEATSSSASKPSTQPAPEPQSSPTPEPSPEQEPTPKPEPQPTPDPAPSPETSPHIEEVLVDPDDIDGDKIMNIEGTGTVEIEGVEFNTAIVTDEAGNTYYMVDVDGEVNDPNATYDIVIDAETGESTLIPTDLSVSDAQLMSDNGIAYTNPTPVDSNNIVHDEMMADVYDPSSPTQEVESNVEALNDPLAVNELNSGDELFDSLS